ncbi:aromatic-amino-acid transaminase [Microvirga flocculans]|uniref:8-amino-7-oxononanoate synthase n=1 Tax=Microvirga flocculans TaxID=217168 RepID=A0A7W6N930_9HYPH|nr:amino acid aminotransferase [Microvirga flocculans]MBB4041043.1 aromatic-amino-acid transaminase [Microvirga flocculans]
MTESLFGQVEAFAGDPILSLNDSFKADPRDRKVNLSIGVYTDEHGRIPVLGSVRAAYERIGFAERPYLPMEGHALYRDGVQKLVFGASHPALSDKRIATIQTIGGTGAVGIAADFLAKHTPGRTVLVSDPTWENHHGLFQRAGFKTATYPYWDRASRSVDFDGMVKALDAAEAGSIVVLQPVCHNPTGVDLDEAQQAAVTDLLVAKGHIVVFDMAYQGFGTSLEADAAFVRRYAARASCLVANSFSKNFSLYGERCGGLSVVCRDRDEAERVLGQLKLAVRRSYSSPPMTGGLLVGTVLGNDDLRAQWTREVETMRNRMDAMRKLLAEEIRKLSNEVDIGFLLNQRGMFSFTGLTEQQVTALRERDGVYLVGSGRMCVAGLNEANVPTVAKSFVDVSQG